VAIGCSRWTAAGCCCGWTAAGAELAQPAKPALAEAGAEAGATYFPPTTTNPLPCVVITTGSDPGVNGWYPPSFVHPLPVVMV